MYLIPTLIVRAATTAALAAHSTNGPYLYGEVALPPQDGVALAEGDLLLVKNEESGTGQENGFYRVQRLDPWTLRRHENFNESEESRRGAIVYVDEGATQADTVWKLPASVARVLGATNDNVTFEPVATAGAAGAAGATGPTGPSGPAGAAGAPGPSALGNTDVTGVRNLYFNSEIDDGNSSTADAIDWTLGGAHKSTLTGNVTYTFTAPTGVTAVTLKIVQDATGSRTITWPAAVKNATALNAALTKTLSTTSVISFYWDGTNYWPGIVCTGVA